MHSALIRLLLTVACGLLLVPGAAVAAVTPTGSLAAARTQFTATALPGGATTSSVLAVGGYNPTGTPLATAERYDVATGVWSAAAAPGVAHADHHAVLLPSGNVFIVGGRTLIRGVAVADSQAAEQYDPVTNTWDPNATKPSALVDDTATLVPFRAGPRVIVAGGRQTGALPVGTVEAYDPAGDAWATLTSMTIERRNHAAVTLPDGRLLVAGGFNANGGMMASTEIYNPTTNVWTAGPAMSIPRSDFTLTLVDNTHILAAGGTTLIGGVATPTATAEVLDPAAGGWQSAGSMAVARTGQQATLVRSGWVVMTGGTNGASPNGLDSAEQWTPTNGWGGLYNLPGSTSIGGARVNHAAAAIPQTDEVLVAGGGLVGGGAPGTITATAARWTPDKPVVVPPEAPPITPETPPVIAPVPVQNRTLVASRVSGNIFIRIGTTDEYRELKADEGLPVGTVIDATDGHVRITGVYKGVIQSAEFWGGTFTISQPKSDGYIEIRLYGKLKCSNKKATKAVKRKAKPKAWGDGKGRFRTRGEHSSASVRGTRWLVEERCTGTFTKVDRGVVSVRDFPKHKTVSVRAGKNYLAKPKAR